jgi:hypothetical protein
LSWLILPFNDLERAAQPGLASPGGLAGKSSACCGRIVICAEETREERVRLQVAHATILKETTSGVNSIYDPDKLY